MSVVGSGLVVWGVQRHWSHDFLVAGNAKLPVSVVPKSPSELDGLSSGPMAL